jgi:flagellar basal-body rod protein FlgF
MTGDSSGVRDETDAREATAGSWQPGVGPPVGESRPDGARRSQMAELQQEGKHMLRGLYAAATGMEAAANAHEVTSRNLAHASVPGFRKALMSFEAMQNPRATRAEEDLSGAQVNTPVHDFSAGPLNRTGAPLDLALDGDGFFVVEGPQGPLYTRSGTFSLDSDGQLVTPDGLPVKTASGTLTIPPNTPAAEIVVGADGTVRVGKEELGQLDLRRFDDPQSLEAVGATLFQAPADVVAEPAAARVVQGAREMSNVSPVNELVNLIAAQRHYEMSQKAATSMDRAAQKRIDLN